jgi:hypothetical protein
VAVAVIVGVILSRPPKEPDLQANAGGQPAIYRSQEIQVVSPVGDVPEIPRSLQWQPFSGAGSYKVMVMDVDNSPLWSAETKEATIEIPPGVRVKMLPGKPILWQVSAMDERGQILGSSQIQRFASPRQHSSQNPQPSQ